MVGVCHLSLRLVLLGPFGLSFGPLWSSKLSSWGPSGRVSCLRPLRVELGVAHAPLQMPKCMVLYSKTNDFERSPVRPKVPPRALKGAPWTPLGGHNAPPGSPLGSPKVPWGDPGRPQGLPRPPPRAPLGTQGGLFAPKGCQRPPRAAFGASRGPVASLCVQSGIGTACLVL